MAHGPRGKLLCMVLLVAHQLGLETKACSALAAVVRLLARVDAGVLDEVGVATEAPATLAAFVRLLTGVGTRVVNEVGALPKAFATLTARVRPDTVVGLLVLQEVGALAEAFPTGWALVGPLACVHTLVFDASGAVAEDLPTLAAHVGFEPGVDALVLQEVGALAEALSTLCTGVGFLASMDPPVLDEVGTLAEALATFPAQERALPGVHSLVLDEVDAPAEALATLGADGGPLCTRGSPWGCCHPSLSSFHQADSRARKLSLLCLPVVTLPCLCGTMLTSMAVLQLFLSSYGSCCQQVLLICACKVIQKGIDLSTWKKLQLIVVNTNCNYCWETSMAENRKDSQAEAAKPTKQAIRCHLYSCWILADPCLATPTTATNAIIGQAGLINAASTKGRQWQLLQKKCRRTEQIQW
uniref:Secreted protein n=1 Tax=Pavo cristatus TaxID=9049 RepID=A0A8C9G9M9_PAVCR